MTRKLETEEELVARAQSALSRCNWEIGDCAARWTERHARGRTDADFGALIGLSGDQVFQRRRVWETFSDVYEQYPALKWSHFYAAINWDDAAECLQWANDMQSTVAEMKAWRRAQLGEDLTTVADEPPFAPGIELLSMEPGLVRDPASFGGSSGSTRLSETEQGERAATALAVAREAEPSGGEYAPFGKGARGPAPGAEKSSPAATAEQIVQRIASALEKCDAALTPDVLGDFPTVPLKLQARFFKALDALRSKSAGLR